MAQCAKAPCIDMKSQKQASIPAQTSDTLTKHVSTIGMIFSSSDPPSRVYA
jgi:hypothetical protein